MPIDRVLCESCGAETIEQVGSAVSSQAVTPELRSWRCGICGRVSWLAEGRTGPLSVAFMTTPSQPPPPFPSLSTP